MSKGDITFNRAQVKELKWFCANVTGFQTEYYALRDQFGNFKGKMERLLDFCDMFERYIERQEKKEQASAPEVTNDDSK